MMSIGSASMSRLQRI